MRDGLAFAHLLLGLQSCPAQPRRGQLARHRVHHVHFRRPQSCRASRSGVPRVLAPCAEAPPAQPPPDVPCHEHGRIPAHAELF